MTSEGAAPHEGGRRVVHLATGLLGVAAARLPPATVSLLLAALFAAALVLEALRLRSRSGAAAIHSLAGSLFRTTEARRVSGATLLVGAYLLAWLLFPPPAAARAMTVAAVADPAAALAGTRLGRSRGRKTWIGTAAAGLAAFAVLLVWPTATAPAALAAIAAALAERAPGHGVDNVAVPVAAGAVLFAFA